MAYSQKLAVIARVLPITQTRRTLKMWAFIARVIWNKCNIKWKVKQSKRRESLAWFVLIQIGWLLNHKISLLSEIHSNGSILCSSLENSYLTIFWYEKALNFIFCKYSHEPTNVQCSNLYCFFTTSMSLRVLIISVFLDSQRQLIQIWAMKIVNFGG